MAIAAYIRVSTEDQNTEGQRKAVEHWCQQRNMHNVRWYIEKASGTRVTGRPEFARLRRAIDRGRIDTVIVYKLDRLMRDMTQGLILLSDWCDQGVRVVSITQRIDLDGVMGKMISALLLAFAELENDYRRARQRAGIEAAKERGVYKGRAKGQIKCKNAPELIRALDGQIAAAPLADMLGVSTRTAKRYLERYGNHGNGREPGRSEAAS